MNAEFLLRAANEAHDRGCLKTAAELFAQAKQAEAAEWEWCLTLAAGNTEVANGILNVLRA